MKVLHLTSLVPEESGNGGKRAVFNHLFDLSTTGVQVTSVMIDVEGRGDQSPKCFAHFSPKVFSRALPQIGCGFRGKLAAVLQFVLGSLPRSAAVVASKEARTYVAGLLRESNFDLVLVDHLNAYALIDKQECRTRVAYIAHNIESDVLAHRHQRERNWSIRKLVAAFDLIKMRIFERRVLDEASRIVLISPYDRSSRMLEGYELKVTTWPELPPIQKDIWSYSHTSAMLFVGSARYFPNREAIEWLVQTLVPAMRLLDPGVTLMVAGTTASELGLDGDPPGVRLLGFVADEELRRLHLACDLFICPVVLGGGIKIKVLEACAYGMPVIATEESLRGIEFLTDVALRLTRDATTDARRVVSLLREPSQLRRMAANILCSLSVARANRPSLLHVCK